MVMTVSTSAMSVPGIRIECTPRPGSPNIFLNGQLIILVLCPSKMLAISYTHNKMQNAFTFGFPKILFEPPRPNWHSIAMSLKSLDEFKSIWNPKLPLVERWYSEPWHTLEPPADAPFEFHSLTLAEYSESMNGGSRSHTS
jgi:hypothetical protein